MADVARDLIATLSVAEEDVEQIVAQKVEAMADFKWREARARERLREAKLAIDKALHDPAESER